MSSGSSGWPVLWLSTHAVQLTVPIGDDGQLMSSASSAWPVLWLSTHAVQLTVPMGDEGQLMSSASSAWPVLWCSIHAVQLTVPMGDDGQLMSFSLPRLARPMTWYKWNTRQTFPCLFRSSDFSVPFRLLFSARQPFSSVLRRWGFPTAR